MKIHLDQLPHRMRKGELVALDTEMYGMDRARLHRPHGDLACLTIAAGGGDVWVLTTPRDLVAALKRVNNCEWVMQKGEFDIRQWRRWASVPPRRYWDTFYTEKALYSNYYDRFGLDSLSRRWLQRPMSKEAREDFYDADCMTKEMLRYAARDAMTTLEVAEAQMALCNGPEDPDAPGMSAATMIENVWYGTDLPALWAILDMRGVCIDTKAWETIADEQEAILAKHLSELDYNPGSSDQVRERLISEGHKLKKKTKGGKFSTDEDVLKELKDSETAQDVLTYRAAQKFSGTYGRKFLDLIEPDGRIYDDFNIYGTETGRFSSHFMQLIPKRDPIWGPRYRRAFIPAPGNVFIKTDYVQCQVAVLAQVARDEPLIDIFKKKLDVHRANAAWLYNVPIEEVTKEQRTHAKGITFGLQFGEGSGTLAEKEGMTKKAAQEFIDKYFVAHPGVKTWTDERLSSREDFVESLIGRRAWVNPYGGKHADNNRLNSPIQMGEVDIHKRAIAKMHQHWPAEWGPFGLVLPVHDELVFEVGRKHAQACKRLVRECALEAEAEMLPDVRAAADVEVCKNWWGDPLKGEKK